MRGLAGNGGGAPYLLCRCKSAIDVAPFCSDSARGVGKGSAVVTGDLSSPGRGGRGGAAGVDV